MKELKKDDLLKVDGGLVLVVFSYEEFQIPMEVIPTYPGNYFLAS